MRPISTQVTLFIPRQRQTVFEYFADLRHEPECNPKVHDVRQTTGGPLARGSRFEGVHDGIGKVTRVEVSLMKPFADKRRIFWLGGIVTLILGFIAAALLLPGASSFERKAGPTVRVPRMGNIPPEHQRMKLEPAPASP